MTSRFLLMMFAVFALLVTGCGEDGPKLAEIEGTVTYKGAPVNGASVTMLFEGDLMAVGSTQADGKFTVMTNGRPGAPIGKAKVTIVKRTSAAGAAMGAAPKPEDMIKMAQSQMGKGPPAAPTSEIPEKYSQPDKSGLEVDVKAGDKTANSFTFALTDD